MVDMITEVSRFAGILTALIITVTVIAHRKRIKKEK